MTDPEQENHDGHEWVICAKCGGVHFTATTYFGTETGWEDTLFLHCDKCGVTNEIALE